MTIQVSAAVDVSLEHSSTTAEMVEVPSHRINPLEEECEREPLMSSGVVEVEQLLELLEEQEDQEESEEGEVESSNNTSDSDNSSNHNHQGKLIRRDSDTSDVSSTDGNDNNNQVKAVSPEVAERIISQVEVMFSDDHLAKDGFLLKHVRRRSDGFVSLKLVAGLRKVKQISRDFPVVMNSLRSSSKLEVNSEGTKIRRIEPLTPLLKSLPTTGQNKETKKEITKENIIATKEKEVPITAANNKDASDEQQVNRNNNNGRNNRNNRQVSRKMSTVSTGSSNGGSRHGSFSNGKPHPAELFRNVMSCTSSSASCDDTPQTPRRRGGSLPIATGNPRPYSYNISPNSSPPNPGLRPKSNSYCEGQNINGPATTTMSPWLMKRKQSTRNSEGSIVLSGVLRQPRGPDGTKGFASGYRTLILREKETLLNCLTTVSA